MTKKAKADNGKLGTFSHDEVKALFMAIGIGAVLGVAVEMIDAVLPKQHNMSAIVQSLFEEREARKRAPKSAYDMERPHVGFHVTE